jgi:PRTRC genetic system protein B
MKVVNSLEHTVFKLTKAILLREGRKSQWNSDREAVASIHDIESDKHGRPVIGAGQLMTDSGLKELVKAVVPEQRMRFLPERILACGVEGVLWWRKPGKAHVWFKTRNENDVGERSGLVDHPGLIFFAHDSGWSVFAVKGDERPTESDVLYQAPYYNVYQDGGICTGNAQLPNDCGIEDVDGYEQAFFGSRFTHANVHEKKRLTKFRGGAAALWTSMLNGRRKVFPQNSLVPMNFTLGQWLEKNGAPKKRSNVHPIEGRRAA